MLFFPSESRLVAESQSYYVGFQNFFKNLNREIKKMNQVVMYGFCTCTMLMIWTISLGSMRRPGTLHNFSLRLSVPLPNFVKYVFDIFRFKFKCRISHCFLTWTSLKLQTLSVWITRRTRRTLFLSSFIIWMHCVYSYTLEKSRKLFNSSCYERRLN